MAALSTDFQRNRSLHTPHLLALGVKANTRIFNGAIVCSDAGGLAVPGADTAGLTPHGVASEGFDNTGGSDGVIAQSANNSGSARFVRVDTAGDWEFAVSAGTPKPGASAFIVNDNTVSANATVNSLKIGTFTRPGNEGGWFVDVNRR